MQRIEGEAAWMCPNKWGCGPQICGRIEHFVGRHAMDIDGIGEEVAIMLNKSGLVNDVADLYDLTQEKLVALERFQERSAQRILRGLEASRQVPYARVIFALSIPFVGETTGKVLARHTRDMDTLMSLPAEDLAAIHQLSTSLPTSATERLSSACVPRDCRCH